MNTIEIEEIFISGDHGFVGQDEASARTHQMQSVSSVECVAGKGLKGDRYFDHKENFKGQVTFFSKEFRDAVFEHIGVQDCPPWAMRRNVMVSGIDLNNLIGAEFEIDGVRFFGTEECAPCRWMNRSIGEGARDFLKGNGGLRARILSDGELRCGSKALALS